MKCYIASRMRNIETVKKMTAFLEARGHIALSEWVNAGSLKPYTEHESEAGAFAQMVVADVLKCDVFILISDEGGTDMFVELGLALGANQANKQLRVYIVGEHSKRSLMQLHPAIRHAHSFKDVLEKEGISGDAPDF